TQIGAITGVDGDFTLPNVPSSAKTLVISYIGMQTQEVAIKSHVRVVMKSDSELLEEVVITGYGSGQKLGSVVGSVTAVGSEKLEKKPVANVADALQGQVAGLQVFTPSGEPSQSVRMRLRGVSSINSSSEPLFILDGSPISAGTFTALNPNDIESMTVLKDASSTAIYGSRAANGVVILTSKKGKRGSKATINISAQYGVSRMTGDNVEMMNAQQWLNFQEALDPSMKNNAAFQEKKNFYINNGISTDWADIFFGGSAPVQQYDLNVSGGTDAVNYYFAFGHYDADGIMDDSNLRRETLRSNLESNINKWLKAGINLNLSHQKYSTTAFGGSGNSVYNKAYASRVYRPTQTYYEILKDDNGNFLGFGDRLNFFDELGYWNPYYLSEIQPGNNTMARINGNTYVNINPIKGLNIRAAQAMEAFDYRTSGVALPMEPFKDAGTAKESFQRYYAFTYTNTAEYKFTAWDRNHFSFLLGQESIIRKNESFGVSVEGLTDTRLMLMSAGATPKMPSHSKNNTVFNSYFVTGSYNFDEKYYLDATFRRDGSSLFGLNNQWGNFWSAGAMWDLKKEAFLNDVDWLDDLQLKVSYGSVGNSLGLDPYMSFGLIGTGPLYGGTSGTAVANPANPDLTWEVLKSTNVALSTRLFDRVSLDVEYYQRKTEDMLMEIPYSYTTGFSTGWGNVASMVNRGVDITANVDILKNVNGLDWSISANVNYNKNEITELFNGLDEYVLANTGLKLQKGMPYGEYYYVRWAGVDSRDGYNMWYDKNGNLTKNFSDDDAVFTGKQRYAPWSGGFGTRASWKGITVAADFSFMLGQYMVNNERWFTENPTFAAKNNQTTEMLTMWQKPGDITNISCVDSPMQFDTHLLENASFMRLKNLTVSYTFPQRWMKKTGFMENAKVFFVGRNLWTVTKYKGYDPEIDSNIQLGNYPNTKQFSFGVELTF
ncbi:TonB-dependent receptor, partial [Bacteroides sp. KH569_7]